MRDDKAEFLNTTTGYVGAIVYTPKGEEKSIAVGPGETVWLSEDEQELTAHAPRAAADSPFVPQPYEIHDPQSGDVVESGERPQLELVTESRPIPGRTREVPGVPARHAPEGQFASGEEVGVPELRQG